MSIRVSQMTVSGTLTGAELIEVSQKSTSITITATTISAAATDNSYNDSASGFVTAGFAIGDAVTVSGFTGSTANNIASGIITALTPAKMTIGGTDGNVIVDDAAGESVTISKWVTRRTTPADLRTLFGIYVGAGSPEGAVTAGIGSIYRRTDGGANTTLYVKESGTGNTGWVAK